MFDLTKLGIHYPLTSFVYPTTEIIAARYMKERPMISYFKLY